MLQIKQAVDPADEGNRFGKSEKKWGGFEKSGKKLEKKVQWFRPVCLRLSVSVAVSSLPLSLTPLLVSSFRVGLGDTLHESRG